MNETYVDNKGTKIWTCSQGRGAPFILCNGGPGCDDYLGPVSEMIDDLCMVVRFEPRGCGRSDWDKHYDLETTIGDIDFIRNVYRFNKIIIGGHSFGVGLSLAYALIHPDKVLGVIGVSGGCIVDDWHWFKTYQENLEKVGEDNGGKEYRSDPEVTKMGNMTWRAFITNPTLLSDLSALDVPVIFINAGNDIRPNWPTIQLAHLIKKGEYVEIPGAGHYIWITHCDELKKKLRIAVGKIIPQQ